jgi:hypothetical protein
MSTLTPSDFLMMTEQQLRPTQTPISRAALIAFIDGAFPLIEDHPAPDFWADRFLEGVDVMAPA